MVTAVAATMGVTAWGWFFVADDSFVIEKHPCHRQHLQAHG